MTNRTAAPRPTTTRQHPATVVTAAGLLATAWCLGFAAVSVLQLATGPAQDSRYASYASGLATMEIVVLVLKVLGAGLALAAITPGRLGLPARVIAVGLWGAFDLLALYSAGSLVITAGTLSGLLEPSEAWTAAGGVTSRAVLYLLFDLVGAAAFGMLAISFHRRHALPRTVAAVGLVGAPLLLAFILAVMPALLGSLGLLPT
jgi:hypothetical protein